MIPGPEVTLGTVTYTVPPLPWNALKRQKEFLSRAQRGEIDPARVFEGDFASMFDCVFSALKRNYPELTEDALGDVLDMRNVADAFGAVMRSAGFREKPAGEPEPAGASKT